MPKVTLYRPTNQHGNKDIWYAKWRLPNGKYERKSLKTTKKKLAEAIRDSLEEQLIRQEYGLPIQKDYKAADAWAEYERIAGNKATVGREKVIWDEFFKMSGLDTIRSVRRINVTDWQIALQSREEQDIIVDGKKVKVKPNDPVTVNSKTRRMCTVFSRLIEEQLYDGANPFAGRANLDEGAEKIRVIQWETIEALIDRARTTDINLYFVIVLGGLLGFRKAEILRAEWGDINWAREEFRVRGTKTKGSDDIIHLHAVVREHLEPYRRDTGYIVRPEKEEGKHVYRYEFRKKWETLCKKLEIDTPRLHDLRHSFATRLLDLGVPMKDIARMLRHASTRMTEHYADLRTVKARIGRIDAKSLSDA